MFPKCDSASYDQNVITFLGKGFGIIQYASDYIELRASLLDCFLTSNTKTSIKCIVGSSSELVSVKINQQFAEARRSENEFRFSSQSASA